MDAGPRCGSDASHGENERKHPFDVFDFLQVALALHGAGQYAAALEQWSVLLESHRNDAEIAYNAAVSMQYLGQVEGAASL